MSSTAAVDTPRLRVVQDRRTALPAPLTTFVGREKAIAEVVDLVRAHRLVTLTGPGGSGKTRLCIEVGRQAVEAFADGAVWVELAPLADAELVSQTVAAALGIRAQPGRSAGDALAEHLAQRRVLLVLDNCEHVVDAAAELALRLLQEAAGVHVLCTSRERLGVTGERTWPVPPLGLPPRGAHDLDRVLEAEAVRLFMDRAAMVLPVLAVDATTASAIAEICTRLDGIPLAIELAAARTNVLSPRQIAERLADSMALLTTGPRTLPRRQRTLRATIGWSHDLLTDAERVLFGRLSVFAGGFTLGAAEAVCGDDVLPHGDVLDVLASLVDKSLVAVRERDGEARYRLLETVRQYARERLDDADDLATRRRHATYYCGLVVDQAPALRSPLRHRFLPTLDAELDNIRAALDFTGHEPALRTLHHAMIGQLWFFWMYRVLWDEGVQRFAAALADSDGVEDALLADTFHGGGVLSWVNGMPLQARLWLDRAIALYRDGGNDAGLGLAQCALAPALLDLGDRDGALAAVRAGMPLVRRTASSWDLAMVLTSAWGYVHHAGGLPDEAEAAYLEAEQLWSEPADEWGRSLARNSSGVLAWRRGELDRAEAYVGDALRSSRAVRDPWFASRSLQVLGYIAMQRAQPQRAARLLASSESLRDQIGARLMPFEVPEWIRATDAARTQLGDAAFEAAWKDGLALGFGDAIDQALGAAAHEPVTDAAPAPPLHAQAVQPVAAAASPASSASAAAAATTLPDAPLTIRALGPLEVRRNARALTNEDWTYAKPRELLFYLLLHPEGRTKEQIGLDLWPESPPARLRSSFHVTMHHLRRVLGGADWVTFHEGRYRFERVEACACDFEHFELLLGGERAARSGASPDDVAARMQQLEHALALYRGDFLDDAGFGDWSLEPRDRLRRRYAAAAIELASLYHAARRFDDAAETCRRLLARDNLDERAHHLLIQSLADAGRPAEALRHHQVMVALFREELGIAPSAETARLVDGIVAAN